MSLLPNDVSLLDQAISETLSEDEELPLYKEYAWDFKSNKFILEDGKFKIVQGNEALKVWIWKTLKTVRYRYLSYSWNYGQEYENLIGKGLSAEALKLEVQRYIKEALLINPYIKDIYNLSISIDGSKLNVEFITSTIYGEVDIHV